MKKADFDIYKIKQLEAITNILGKTEDYFQRKVCRWFSEKYSTPLPEVERMEWDYLLTHYYEAALEDMDYNNVFDMAQHQYIEEFMEEDEVIRQQLEEELIEEQEQSLKKKEKKKQENEQKIKEFNMSFDEELDDDEDGTEL